jgi:oxygen-dependent protoporphyrinogen oxidase
MSWPERVAVVGAGPAGLAAAWSLVGAGRQVTLFEERASVGGRMRSDLLDGAIVDVAVQLLSSTYRRFLQLAQAAGMSDRLVATAGRDALWRGGRPHVIAYGSVSSMITSSALPAGLKFRLGTRYLPFLRREAHGLDANDPAHTGGTRLDDASVAEWGHEALGEDFVELMAYPLLATYCGGTPEQTSAAMYHALARVGLDVRVLAVRGGMGTATAAIAAAMQRRGAEIRTDARVLSVSKTGERIEVHAPEALPFDAVVLAVPARVARELLKPNAAADDWLAQVRTHPAATAAFLVSSPRKQDWFALSVPRRTEPGKRIVALCAAEAKHAQLVPESRGLLVVYPAPEYAARVSNLEPEQAVTELLPAMDAVMPGLSGSVLRARVYRFADGYTVFYPGYLRHLAAYRPDWLPRGIALAGDYLAAPTVEGAVLSGERAVAHLLRQA